MDDESDSEATGLSAENPQASGVLRSVSVTRTHSSSEESCQTTSLTRPSTEPRCSRNSVALMRRDNGPSGLVQGFPSTLEAHCTLPQPGGPAAFRRFVEHGRCARIGGNMDPIIACILEVQSVRPTHYRSDGQ